MVPYTSKGAIEDELDSLERQQIMEKDPHSEWTTARVPVLKPDGSVRLCCDFQPTANQTVAQHPTVSITKSRGSFAIIAGGQKFMKLDLSQAYL